MSSLFEATVKGATKFRIYSKDMKLKFFIISFEQSTKQTKIFTNLRDCFSVLHCKNGHSFIL